MKRILLSAISVLLLAMTVVVPVFAGANDTWTKSSYTLIFDDVVDPCTGNPVDADISGTFTKHEVSNSDSGNITTTYKLRGTLTLRDPVTNQVSSGPVIWNWSEAGGFDGPLTRVWTARITNPGPGNNLLLVANFHVSPNDMVVSGNLDHLNHVCLDQPGN